jgi:phage tail sheath protein FI
MPFQVSPGVTVVEKDLSLVIPQIAASIGATAGFFRWGPAEQPITITSEANLATEFGKPVGVNDFIARSFFTAANFLSYSSNMVVVRALPYSAGVPTAFNALSEDVTPITVKSGDDYLANYSAAASPNASWVARYPGSMGNTLEVSVCDADSFRVTATGTIAATQTSTALAISGGAIATQAMVGSVVQFWSGAAGTGTLLGTSSIASITSATAATLASNPAIASGIISIVFLWEFASEFVSAPGTSQYASTNGYAAAKDEMHVIVVDRLGMASNVRGQVLEKYENVSKAADAVLTDGSANYYKTVINRSSNWIWNLRDLDDIISGTYLNTSSAADFGVNIATQGMGANVVFKSLKRPYTTLMGHTQAESTGAITIMTNGKGVDGYTASSKAHDAVIKSGLLAAFGLFTNTENIDVGLIAAGEVEATVANYIINSIAEVRKDCVVFISAAKDDGSTLTVVTRSADFQSLVNYRTALTNSVNVSSSYGVMDSGYKYMYDKYNDKYIYVPLNGDTAGLCARTDYTADPWFSPGGYNRGTIKNVVKLSYNPSLTERDTLYKNGINPVTTFPGQGTVLFGDKTMLTRPSAFDRINVRRLFIILEKSISTAAKFQLFEFNDGFTRAQFKNLVEPFLRDVQGRRGIFDFRVICDTTNNTGEIIDTNQFVADIYVKPARSINFITLNFIAARTSVNFTEIGG